MNDQNPSTPIGDSDIAVIAMSCRFPGANDVETFWRNLRDGVESISFFSDEELLSSGIAPELFNKPNYVKARGILSDVELFDASAFGFSPREAEILDPQHRLFLECAWEVVERAGYAPGKYGGSIGVYAGVGRNVNTYLMNNLYPNRALAESVGGFQLSISNDKDYLATRVSYKLDLRGPSVNVQTACSTSLVAIHLACQSLLNGECDMAMAGGSTICIPQKSGYLHREGMIFSPDGHCRAFDAEAGGFVGGNGVGVILLKRLADALADGDRIEAIVRGTAVNNDGSVKVGYTAPSVNGQKAVITEALAVAGVDPGSVTYIETHGTATALGDTIEIAALTQAFRTGTDRKGYCAVGSVKANVGHLDAAAGVAGVIKTVLAFKHRMLPPSLHFKTPNPKIDFANSPFYVNAELSEWNPDGFPRRAGVSSFGIGGTNAHVVLEEFTQHRTSGESRPWQLLMFSAGTDTALETATANAAEYLKRHPDVDLADVAFTLQVGRRDLARRRMLVCRDHDEAVSLLRSPDPTRVVTEAQDGDDRPVVFMFSGQGAQYVNMALDLYEVEPTFRERVDLCSKMLRPHLGFDLRTKLYPGGDETEAASEELKQTAVTQPALFVIEYAMAKLWMEWGVRPRAMVGHSIGEYVAACIAGVFSLEEALALVVARGRLMQQLPGGAMLVVPLPEKETKALLGSGLSLASVNGPSLCVVSGSTEAVDALRQRVADHGVEAFRLHTSHAFHSEMMDSILEPFVERVADVDLKPPRIPYVSNITGSWITATEATDPRYWADHLRRTVRFSDGVRLLLEEPEHVLLEVGPGRTLGTLVKQHLENNSGQVVLASLRHPHDRQSDVAFLLNSLGRLWLAGVRVDWTGFHAHESRHRLPLPTYPFERERYWIEPGDHGIGAGAASPDGDRPDKKHDIAEWFYVPSWKRLPLPPGRSSGAPDMPATLIFVDGCGVGSRLAGRLKGRGADVVTVGKGTTFTRTSDHEFTINPEEGGHYDRLLDELRTMRMTPRIIFHLWSVTENEHAGPVIERIDEAVKCGFYSLVFLAQALGRLNVADEIHIAIVSNNMQEVTGEELLYPEKATVIGPARVIPQEYPNISCRCIDITIRGSRKKNRRNLATRLLEEVRANSSDIVVAYRGNHRWVQVIEPVRLGESNDPIPLLKEEGVYLITGGLGGLGLVLAEHLAKTLKPKLALLGRSEFPPREEWEQWLSEHDGPDRMGPASDAASARSRGRIRIDMSREEERIDRTEQKIDEDLGIKGIEHYEGFEGAMNSLCACYICDYLTSNGIEVKKGRRYGKRELRARLNVLPKFEKFLDFFIKILAEDEIVDVQNDEMEFIKDIDVCKDTKALRKSLEKKYAEFKGLFRFLQYCVDHYSEALSGEIPAITVIYPEGRSDRLRQYSKDTVEYGFHRIYRMLLGDIVHRVVGRSKDGKLKILEIGAGGGRLTDVVVTGLKDRNVEYHFTDIGKSFVGKAERKYGKQDGLDFMRFGLLDISRDPAAQNYPKHTFDIIIGSNVVHATRSIRETVGHLKTLLAPNGILCLIEDVRSYRWIDMIWGLAEGWWYFEDEDLRKDSPLLDLDTWEEILTEMGFGAVATYPRNEVKRSRTNCGLIIAQRTDAFITGDSSGDRTEANDGDGKTWIRDGIEKLKSLEEHGAEIFVLSADVSDGERMADAVSLVHKRFGRINGVIHAAGLPDGVMIQRRTREDVERIFASKIRGTLLLDEIFESARPDFIALCSSLASTSGGVGLVAHVAASAFQDAYASYQSAGRGPFTVSIDWGAWEEVGQAAARVERLSRARKSFEGRSEEVAHPLFDRCTVNCFGGETYVTEINSKDYWVLDEHVLMNRATLPGTAYLEMARAAFERHAANEPIELRDVYFLAPLTLEGDERLEVRTVLREGGNDFEFFIISRADAGDDAWRLHARGRMSRSGSESSERYAIEEIASTCEEPVESAAAVGNKHPSGLIARGPRWNSIQWRRFGEGRGLAFLELPEAFVEDIARYKLHPALIDCATGFCLARAGTGGIFVPFSYKRIRIRGPVPSRIYSYARFDESGGQRDYLRFDIVIMDEAGKTLVEIDEYTLIEVDVDTFAESSPSRSTAAPASISDIFSEGGRVARAPVSQGEQPREGILAAEGIEAFARILRSELPHVLVSPHGVGFRSERSGALASQAAVETMEKETPSVPAHPRPEISSAYRPPRSETEQALARMWQEFLGIERVGVDDNFFELNGDSLLATQVITRVREAFSVDLALASMFENPTVARLGELIERARRAEVESPSGDMIEGSDREEGEI